MSDADTAIVLLSGGLDSATTLAMARAEGRRCIALTFSYGQRCLAELEATRRIAAAMNVRDHHIIHLEPSAFGGSALTGDAPVPKLDASPTDHTRIPITYVPARNIVFLAHGLAWSESVGAGEIFIGVNAVDYSGYPDCRPLFIDAFQHVIDVGTRGGVERNSVRIRAPLIDLPKHEIIRRGLELGVDYALTMSCYDPDAHGLSCGNCESCRIRRDAFAKLRIEDPVPYAA